LVLKLYLGSLQIHLLSMQTNWLLLNLVHVAARTLVWHHELGSVIDKVFAIDVEAHARRGIVVEVVRIVLRAVPQEDLKESTQRGDIGPRHTGEDGAPWCLTADNVLQLQLEGCPRILDPKRQVREVVLEALEWRKHLTSGYLVMDIVQPIEHLVAA
jgi:hypothetical protein